MQFLVKSNWKDLSRTTWRSLEKSKSAPSDMYIELLRFARNKLGIEVNLSTDMALSDPQLARQQFMKLRVPSTELDCIEMLEGFYDVLNNLTQREVARHYLQALKTFIDKRNLRYNIADNCKFRLSVPGLLVSQFSKLQNGISRDPDLVQAMLQLEASLSKLESSDHEERNCIGIATNLLEGIARQKTTNGQPTLGAAIGGCNVFPHGALRECIRDFYRFASDYPNIRHAGTPANKLRELKKDDAVLAILLAIGFGSFVFDNDAGSLVLRGNL